MSWRIEVKPTAEKQYVKLDKTGRLWMRFASSTLHRLSARLCRDPKECHFMSSTRAKSGEFPRGVAQHEQGFTP